MSSKTSPWVMDVTEAEFDSLVMEKSTEKPVIVDFWAPWCGPCRALGPLLEKVVNEQDGAVLLAKVNSDENPNLSMQFGIRALPTVVAIRDKELVLNFEGALPEQGIRQFVQQLLPTDAEQVVKDAEELESSDPAKAETLYRQALEKDNRLDRAKVGLARLLVNQDKQDEAKQLLENAAATGQLGEEEDRIKAILELKETAGDFGDAEAAYKRLQEAPEDPQRQYELGCVLAAAGKYQEAMDLLLSAGEKDASLASSKVREEMVRIFNIVGSRSELANEYRKRLTAILI